MDAVALRRGSLAWFGRQTHNQYQTLTAIDWSSFKTWLDAHLANNYASDVLRYCLKYSDILLNNEPHKILLLSKDKQRLVMSSLSNLAKFLSIYPQWKESMHNSGLKWSKNDSFNSFMRIFNNNHGDLIEWYHKAIDVLNDNEKLYLRFMLLSGLRKNEGIQSFNLIIDLYKQNKLNEYFNEELSVLEHFKFKQFLRNTKNVYISILPKELIFEIANSKSISYSMIRKRLLRNNLKVRIKELRSYYASYMVKNRILISEEADLCQGRIPKSVFARHYLKENLKELSSKILVALTELEQSVNN
jgi:hypothetical protein